MDTAGFKLIIYKESLDAYEAGAEVIKAQKRAGLSRSMAPAL